MDRIEPADAELVEVSEKWETNRVYIHIESCSLKWKLQNNRCSIIEGHSFRRP